MLATTLFYLFTSLMLIAALLVVTLRHPIASVLSLLVSMFCLSGLFVLLGAYFVAAIQILVYAGAILVLFLFVIMLLDLGNQTLARTRQHVWAVAGWLLGGALLYQLCAIIRRGEAHLLPTPEATFGTTEQIGRLLFTDYLLPFEWTSFLLLAAIVGAVVLSRKQLR